MHDAAKIEMQGIGGADICCRLVGPAAWKKLTDGDALGVNGTQIAVL